MADLILRFQIESQIVHETRLTTAQRGATIKTVGDVKKYLASQLTIPVETICLYDDKNYLLLASNPSAVVHDLENDRGVPGEKETVWYWSYIAEEPEEYKTKRDRCVMILDTAIEQVTTDMNLSLFGLFRKVVLPEDPISESQWIDINLVDLDTYKSVLPIAQAPSEILRVYQEHNTFLVTLQERLVKRVEILGRDMGLAVGNIHSMFLNLKRMEESEDMQNLNGPIGEADLEISVVRRERKVNCGLIAGIAEGPFGGPLPLPGEFDPQLENVAVEAAYVETNSGDSRGERARLETPSFQTRGPETPSFHSRPRHETPSFQTREETFGSEKKVKRRRQSLVENNPMETDVIIESRHHLVQNVTSRTLDFTFTSNLFDIQKVSGIFVNLKKERSECLKMIHQLETRRRLWELREYLFFLRSLIPNVHLYKAEWKVISSNYKLKRRRITHISQGSAAFAAETWSAAGYFSASTEYRTEITKTIIPGPDPVPFVPRYYRTTFAEECMEIIKTDRQKFNISPTWKTGQLQPAGQEIPKWSLGDTIICYQLSYDDKPATEEPEYGIYLSNGIQRCLYAIIGTNEAKTMFAVCEAIWSTWLKNGVVKDRIKAYVK